MQNPSPSETQAAELPEAVEKQPDHSLKTGMWMLGVVLLYYALQAWILPAAGVQT